MSIEDLLYPALLAAAAGAAAWLKLRADRPCDGEIRRDFPKSRKLFRR